jgi:hypothetical protein
MDTGGIMEMEEIKQYGMPRMTFPQVSLDMLFMLDKYYERIVSEF